MFDLHCHSYYSDGTDSPESLLKKAITNGVRCLALTDHDSIEGLEPLRLAAKGLQGEICLINGIELTAVWKKHLIHILGLNLQNPEALTDLIALQQQHRHERAQKIGVALEKFGVENAYAKAAALAGHDAVGRPHFARMLLSEGKVKTEQAAFKQYLGRGRPAYIPVAWISLETAIEGIREAGGQAVLAHPLKYGLTQTKLSELIKAFKESGGEGLEVISGETSILQQRQMVVACQRFDLLASSGSDYHGETISRRSLGRQGTLPPDCQPIWSQWNLELQGRI